VHSWKMWIMESDEQIHITLCTLFLTAVYRTACCFFTGTSGSSTSERPRVRPSARPNTNAANSETPTSNPAAGSGRPRGRPKKRPMEPSAFGASPASEHKKSGKSV
jgi:hypothetical protein